ncbi:DNase I-like protein [Tilletiaria anomala UBC 951]|uniref:phosphoinositide 5-phosphatase n=1 Tax=Tilletiaria anomala (strain ATCC 24038 / CBS 436.72 / UBC 951) TaxID=1037660 RepID=A0A066WRA4_TILAU|nr:DNase I-like protein [Tilletiaria anomala UBC 951]KDN53180.1 DNase I-like protein [Tilletiaria anomala UBC 951]
MHVYLCEAPRALVITGNVSQVSSQGFALVVSAANSSQDGNRNGASTRSAAKVAVKLVDLEEVPITSMKRLTQTAAAGCLGIMNAGSDIFLACVTASSEVGAIRPREVVMRIGSVSFFCINKSLWDNTVVSESSPDHFNESSGPNTSEVQSSIYTHPCAGLQKYMSGGTFYYAKDRTFDLSTRLDARLAATNDVARAEQPHGLSEYDSRFVWNTYMLESLIEYRSRLVEEERGNFDAGGFLMCAIQGYVGVQYLSGYRSALSSDKSRAQNSVAVISRLSWKRAGTRFNARGIDDDGNVANFVESELIFCHDGITYSHVQLRGSVPLFWEQAGMQAINTKIQITRPQVASQLAFDRHFAELISHYSHVHALNLLGTRDIETVLTAAYSDHMEQTSAETVHVLPPDESLANGAADMKGDRDALVLQGDDDRVALSNFDFHSTSRAVGGIDGVRGQLKNFTAIQAKTASFGFTIIDREGHIRMRQLGVFRTNCLDCLDRTNVVQDFLSQFALDAFLSRASAANSDTFVGFANPSHHIWSAFRSLWGYNGDALSRIYAGTGALNTSFTKTGKKTLGGMLSNAVKSAARTYINNFQDKDKQNVIDMLLGLMANQQPVKIVDVVHDAVEEELLSRLDEFSTTIEISIFTGTWNLNARPPGDALDTWLFPDPRASPDVYVIGFQEIVELTPQQILMTDPTKKKVWEGAILDAFARRSSAEKAPRYVLIRSEQLVGTALIVLVKEDLLPALRGVEAATKKTGLKGMSGNKGGVGVRLTCYDSSICFVTAHFAAGHSNVEERNADYWTISQGLVFTRGKSIPLHDLVIWLGDFNYRIDLPNEHARQLAANDDYDALYAHDQLATSRDNGSVFPGYEEGPLLFRPTYKYDNGRDTYDSSEKQRVPAWTDRVLYRPDNLKQRAYGRAELKASDHRPVFALFSGEVRSIDHAKRMRLYDELLECKAPERKRPIALSAPLRPLDVGDPGLPYPSSNDYHWWDDSASSEDDEAEPTQSRRAPLLRPAGERGMTSAARRPPPARPARYIEDK